jgi:hypothetical protein
MNYVRLDDLCSNQVHLRGGPAEYPLQIPWSSKFIPAFDQVWASGDNPNMELIPFYIFLRNHQQVET